MVVAGGEAVREAAGGDGAPAEGLFDEGAEVGEMGDVGSGGEAAWGDVGVDFGLESAVCGGVEGYGEHEGHHAVGGGAGCGFEAGRWGVRSWQ